MNETIADLDRILQHLDADHSHKPIRILLNPIWLKNNMPPMMKGMKKPSHLFGVPTELSSQVKTFEFIWNEFDI